jgi:hypothetical protein
MKDKGMKPIDLCRHCVDDDFEKQWFEDDDYQNFNAKYCVTDCYNNYVPKHLPVEQVIKYLKWKPKRS